MSSQEIRNFYSRIHEASKRITERDKFLKDSDRYEDEIRKLKEKGQQTSQVDIKYNTAHTSYLSNNEYLKGEIDEIIRLYNEFVIPKVKLIARTNYTMFTILARAFEPFKDTKCVAASTAKTTPAPSAAAPTTTPHHRHAPPPPPSESDEPPMIPPKRPPKNKPSGNNSVTSSADVENPFDGEDFDNPFDDVSDGNPFEYASAPPPPRPAKAANPAVAKSKPPGGGKPLPQPGKALPKPPPKVPPKQQPQQQHSTQYEIEGAIGRA